MTSKYLLAVFLSAILLMSVLAITVPTAEAKKSLPKSTLSKSITKGKICGDRLCSERLAQQEVKEKPMEKTTEQPMEPMTEQPTEKKMEEKMTVEEKKMTAAHGEWKTQSGTLTSVQDPGVGHESHQLAIILAPSSSIYKGILSYSASENIQLVVLTGPLADGEDKGQPIWTPDGKTKFALTFVDPANAAGTWVFTGNALAVHTKNTAPFTVSYSVGYMENEPSETIKTGTLTSIQDPGVGHESHQLAIILPPSDKPYTGVLTYTASENIQLVSLVGPLADGEDKGQPIWTPDGKTKFALTFVDPANAAGTWAFSGNALAVHTMNTAPFTVSYSVTATQ